MRSLDVSPEAELDVLEAALWYEGERPGLGEEFLRALRRLYERISETPLHFPKVRGETRRALLDRFPYGVFFVLTEEEFTVIAVLDLRRDPAIWQRRR
jgi:plasmid stabilization system protein ParE